VSDPKFDPVLSFNMRVCLPQSNAISANYPRLWFRLRHATSCLLISVSARNIYLLTCWLTLWRPCF